MTVEQIVLALFMLATLVPLAGAVSIWRRRRYGRLFWMVLGIGALGWFVAQPVKSVASAVIFPVLGVSLTAPTEELMRNIWVLVIGAILAGFFEEPFKFIGIFAFRKRIKTLSDSICYGLGAGLGAGMLEAALVGITAYFTVINLAEPVPVDLNLLVGPVERVSASFLHAALTAVFAYLFFSRRPLLGFLIAAGYHTFVDFYAPWLLVNKVIQDMWLLEGLIAVSVIALYPPLLRLNKSPSSKSPISG